MSTEVKTVYKHVNIDDVIVGKRFRKDMGNMYLLQESIGRLGLLQPIVLRKDMTLVCGGRRLEACKALERKQVNAIIVDSFEDELEMLAAERDENTCREEMAVSELVALANSIQEHEEKAARERQRHGATAPGKHKNASDNLSEASEVGDTRERVAAAVGMSHGTLAKAREVVEAAKDRTLPPEVREVAKEAVKEMDETGKVGGAFRKVQEAKGEATKPKKSAPKKLAGKADDRWLVDAANLSKQLFAMVHDSAPKCDARDMAENYLELFDTQLNRIGVVIQKQKRSEEE